MGWEDFTLAVPSSFQLDNISIKKKDNKSGSLGHGPQYENKIYKVGGIVQFDRK